jgi:hypothetical protein
MMIYSDNAARRIRLPLSRFPGIMSTVEVSRVGGRTALEGGMIAVGVYLCNSGSAYCLPGGIACH